MFFLMSQSARINQPFSGDRTFFFLSLFSFPFFVTQCYYATSPKKFRMIERVRILGNEASSSGTNPTIHQMQTIGLLRFEIALKKLTFRSSYEIFIFPSIFTTNELLNYSLVHLKWPSIEKPTLSIIQGYQNACMKIVAY